MRNARAKSILKWSAAGIIAALAIFIVAVLVFGLNGAKPWINERVSKAIGRPFAIRGDLSLGWRNPDRTENERLSWLPWPHLAARDIVIGNPDWATTGPTMANVKEADFSLNPQALLSKNVVIPSLRFDEPNLNLERAADGRNNWTFRSDTSPSEWHVNIQRLVLVKGTVRLVDAIKKADVRADIHTLEEGDGKGYGIGWNMKGRYNGEAVSGSGKAGSVLSLQAQTAPYPVQADIQAGKTRIGLEGTLTKPSDLAALDLQLNLSGASMAHLYPLTGIVLPETPPYSTRGHLAGKLNAQGGNWSYEKFSGKVGSSDLSGTLDYKSGKPRPLLTGSVSSNLLRFQDLAPLIGADSNASKARRGAPVVQPPGKVLPVEPFKTDRWTSIDTNVKFTGRKIVRDKDLPIDNLETTIQLQDGVLNLVPLNFGVAGGSFNSTINLDGREGNIKARMKIAARHLRLNKLLPAFQPMQTSLGEINGDAALTATGNSIAALLGSSNGEVKMLINQGTVSKLLLEEMGLNIGSIVLTSLFGDKQVKINCLASDFAVSNGQMTTRVFIVDTDDAVISVDGKVNLKMEQLNLTINPQSKGVRIISLRAPLYVTGPFKKPKIAVDKGVLALKAGGAVALAIAAPVAALLPLINMGPTEDSACAALLREANKKPVAPPPGTQNKK
jgi:hypothetical protein